MTEKEKFQRTFEKLHASPDALEEVLDMEDERKVVLAGKKRFAPRAAIITAAAIIIGSGGMAYAMDIGGIQKKVQVWLHGEQTDAYFRGDKGSYTLEYTDKDGNQISRGGGGIAYEDDGTERPLTNEELLDEIDESVEVFYEEDGRVLVCYKDQKIDVTDQFEDGFCNTQIETDGQTLYVTIKYKSGCSISPDGYASKEDFE